MTFEKILDDLASKRITDQDAFKEMSASDKKKRINYYIHINDNAVEPLNDSQLQELNTIVNILQILDSSNSGSPVSHDNYDTLEETLIDMGIPRLTGTIEINDNTKVSHTYTSLRGTLDKVYYLRPDEKRTNKSRKYLDEWIKSTEALYYKKTGKYINLNEVKVMLQPKFDGGSAISEKNKNVKPLWITRGDTRNNKASDVSHIMNAFDDVCGDEICGTKYEVMCSEEGKDKINELIRDVNRRYRNSRQVVTATLNSNEPDFKVDYLYPVPLRIIHPGEDIEQIHPKLIEKFPTEICKFGDRDTIAAFANNNRYVRVDGIRLRTDGVVMTIMDCNIQKILGRDNDINNFEVAYKFTEEIGYSRVKNIEFYVSEFGYVTPVVVINDLIMKGNTVNHISINNYERFKELNLHYGDEVRVSYDITPYLTIDGKCQRVPNGRLIEFTPTCPSCGAPLEFENKVMIQCNNPQCPSTLIGKILTYCANLRIKNIGYNTLEVLYDAGLLKYGIRSLYKLKKKTYEIEEIDGFGKLKTKKIIREIEGKRRLKDYDFFGSLSIEGLSIRTFKLIFEYIKLSQFLDMIRLKNYDLLSAKLVQVNGIGDAKASSVVSYFKNIKNQEFEKLLAEVSLIETYTDTKVIMPRVVFSGCRPTDEMVDGLYEAGYEASAGWSNKAIALVIPSMDYSSPKVDKAKAINCKIIEIGTTKDILRKLN